MSQLPKALADLERDLTLLLLEVRGTEIAERARLYVEKFSGNGCGALSVYLHNDALPLKERAALAANLKSILKERDYSRLPTATHPMKNLIEVTGVVPVAGAPNPVESEQTGPAAAAAFVTQAMRKLEPVIPLTEAAVRKIVREELAAVLQSIAKVLKE